MSNQKSLPTQKRNGGTTAAAHEKIMVTNKEFGDLYMAFDTLPGSTIQKNLGNALNENFVNRTWLSAQVGIFHRNTRMMKARFDELYAKQKAYLSQRNKLIGDTIKYKGDIKRLGDIASEMKVLQDDWDQVMEQTTELPPIERIPESLIKDWEILNSHINAFWKYGVDFEK